MPKIKIKNLRSIAICDVLNFECIAAAVSISRRIEVGRAAPYVQLSFYLERSQEKRSQASRRYIYGVMRVVEEEEEEKALIWHPKHKRMGEKKKKFHFLRSNFYGKTRGVAKGGGGGRGGGGGNGSFPESIL